MHSPLGDQNLADVKEMIEGPGPEQLISNSTSTTCSARTTESFSDTPWGTNTGRSSLAEKPSRESWTGSGISIYRFENGKIVEQWDAFEYLGVIRQLALIPPEPGEQSA
jgi:hypothetical protein